MYQMHSLHSIDENVIVNRSRPLLMTEREVEIPYAESA